jgi:FKBP-type peptidyl-prolyl cis-trans isomerase
MRLAIFIMACGAAAVAGPSAAGPAQRTARAVSLPGVRYQVLSYGPSGCAHPTRADRIAIRYVGRLLDGSVFSTSEAQGAGTTTFAVRTVIPGFSALAQLMRPGDRWRMTIPSYLAYGALGRRHVPGDTTLKRDVPPGATLVFDTELVAILPGE